MEISGLDCPPDGCAEIQARSAVQLSIERAGQLRTGFAIADEEAPYVARICRLAGGLPLGIELASAWVRLLSCQEIARQIEQNCDFYG